MAEDKVEYPKAQQDTTEYSFTASEIAEIQQHVAKYPDKMSAVMPALWIAQEKYGWLPQGAIQLVADTLGLSFAHVYGVATFYTMYLKENPAKNLIEICTCFTCGECGGRELYDHAKKAIQADSKGAAPDKSVWVREAECLGACDTPVVVQVNNDKMYFNVDPKKFEEIVAEVRSGKPLTYESIPLIKQ
jgi:NADH-quinone oxidoreductase subunit E